MQFTFVMAVLGGRVFTCVNNGKSLSFDELRSGGLRCTDWRESRSEGLKLNSGHDGIIFPFEHRYPIYEDYRTYVGHFARRC